MSRLGFTLREGWRSFRRGGLSGGLAVIALAILAGMIVALGGTRDAMEEVEARLLTKFEIEAFLQPGHERFLSTLADSLRRHPGVARVDTISKEEAARRFSRLHGEEVLGLLDENPLPASIIIQFEPGAVGSAELTSVADSIAAREHVEDVSWDGELLSRFEAASDRVMWIVLAVSVFVLALALVLTFHSVRAAARSGRPWARAVMIVGGTPGQVRGPLAAGGLFTGLLGGLLGTSIVAAAQFILSTSPWVPEPSVTGMAAGVVVPCVVGVLGAVRAWTRDP